MCKLERKKIDIERKKVYVRGHWKMNKRFI